MQAWPDNPQFRSDEITHSCAILQQPVAHEAALHEASIQPPSAQRWPGRHPRQSEPPSPQARLAVPGWHTLVASMQPVQGSERQAKRSHRALGSHTLQSVCTSPQASV